MSNDAEKKFHMSRVAFAQLSDGRVVITKDDSRSHYEWLVQDYGISATEFETLIRGFIKGNEVIFYKGSDFRPVNNDNIIKDIFENHLADYAECPITCVCDGVNVGVVGERWKPKKRVKIYRKRN